MLIVYYIFVVSYVIKAAYFGMFDWASPYFIATVRTHIGNESFVTALLVVTYCHVVIAILSRNISRSSAVLPQELKDLTRWHSGRVSLLLIMMTFLSVATGFVMVKYGLSVMGTEGQPLPYNIAGIVYYTRVWLVTVIMMQLVYESWVAHGANSLNIRSLILLLHLLSDSLLRASKYPLVLLAILVGIRLIQLKYEGWSISGGKKWVVVIFTGLVVFGMYPAMKYYRAVKVTTGTNQVMPVVAEVARSVSFEDYYQVPIEILHRTVGFTQYAGVIERKDSFVNPMNHEEYDSISDLYTHKFLGVSIAGHGSSPSLLRLLHIYIPIVIQLIVLPLAIVLIAYVISMLEHASRNMWGIKAVLSIVVGNMVIAGTVDAMLRELLIISAIMLLYTLLRWLRIG
ncbi:MAG: hypothetical protein OXT08_04835 [Candidatus Marinimicrobia bacterium]|nr:hypothetical protein [Candidatus Neomarinimicrobiota bacterium]